MMSNITKQYKMNYFDPSENSNKVWIGMAFEDGGFETRFGRVRDGANLASKRKTFDSKFEAGYELERKRNEKLRKGYRDTGTFTSGETIVKTSVATDLKEIATKQISGAEDATTAALVKYLAEVNIHHITHSTSISYNAANATFSTPLGVLSPETVGEARNLLNQISKFNSTSGYSASRRESVIKDYFQLVPKDFGVRIPPVRELLADDKQIQAESAILDALEASINSDAPQTEEEKLFSCKLIKVPHWTDDGKAEFRRVRSLYDSTKNANHQTNSLKLTRLYEVEIETMKVKFDAVAAKIGNIRRDLWHGTRASNLLSILRGGLIIPPPSASHCTGRMFGNGIYTSLQSTKALNYATDFWNRSGKSNQKTFMFLCEAALGKVHKPKSSGSAFPAKNSDSTWVEAGTAGVMNHECIVYDTAQINLCYLAEFGSVADL